MKRRARASAYLVALRAVCLLTLLTAACTRRADPPAPVGAGTSDAFAAAAPITPQSACEAYVRSYCAKALRCDGDSEGAKTCVSHAALCPEYYFAPDATRTVGLLQQCERAFDDLSCTDFLAGVRPACVTPGLRGVGEPCVAPSQCASLECEGFEPDKCGTCTDRARKPTPRLALGAACGTANAPADMCEPNLACLLSRPDARSGTCGALPLAGAPCARVVGSREVRCAAYPVYCRFGDGGVESGTCATAGAPGDSCAARAGGSAAPCDGAKGICATFPDGGGACVPYVQIGGRCGAPFEACTPTAFCKSLAPGRRGGTCTELPGPGAACGATASDAGTTYLRCASGTCAPHPDGGANVCFGPANRARGESCAPPTTSCDPLLSCKSGVCVALDPASCPRRVVSSDAAAARRP